MKVWNLKRSHPNNNANGPVGEIRKKKQERNTCSVFLRGKQRQSKTMWCLVREAG